ncbi:OPT oligopeptide transporter protein [Hirsutella rhossiliensis]|uniref:OPT oligopeptide transporter protein n=1 Tax=Hirsutella rhossiliensis TaxID=111463 RepID=A0A9P8N9A5_9HYPO|nr:OPT oligopeptide transporter protein [Hirsutella rhossiliensis]KAH0968872.1 OPT oligopeptide transporter protein [Hirsutella rhossiliensis]
MEAAMSNDPRSGGDAQSQDEGVFKRGHDETVVEKVYGQDIETEHAHALESHLNATEDDVLEAKELAASMSLESVRALMTNVLAIHDGDPNFPYLTIQNIKEFLANDDIMAHPEKHEQLVEEMKLEAAIITHNSPMPSVFLSFVNQLFSIRQPAIKFDTNIAQLLAFPLGKAWERWMPRYEFALPFTGTKININPGPFNKKEHMLIAIMANTSRSLPYTNYIIWTQVLPQYFNQQYARNFGYMFTNAFATNFLGYGLAGLTRKFLVYPSYCVWPMSLVTIALNTALHKESNQPVLGPFNKTWSMSRYRFFLALSYFTWMTWIAPDNIKLNILTGMQNGLGLFNPIPTLDWNVICFNTDPLNQMVPSFTTFNAVAGMFITGLFVLAVWFTNVWNTGYLPINTNRVYDHFGKMYNVSRALDEHGMFDLKKYTNYSAPYMGAANALLYGWFFAIYTAILTHVILHQRYEIKMGFRNLFRGLRFRKKKATTETANEQRSEGAYSDVHNRLMAAYPEVSEWWYFGILVISVVFGVLGIALWPTYTSPAVVLYGIALCLIFVIPIGVTVSMTGIEITLNVLAEFIGGVIVEGNALAMNFFKSYGYVTCAHAISFANDLKLAHYVKVRSSRVTFVGQMLATLISTLICTGVMKFQMDIKNVRTTAAPMRFLCPGPNTFMTASVLWGTIGPVKVFGINGQYKWLLMGFPVGIVLVTAVWGLKKMWPNSRALRQIHVVAAIAGSLQWAPYSFSYAWPAVPVAWFSWIYIRGRYLALWSKYNFVLSASFSAGVAISAIIMLFSVQWAGIKIEWWGNTQPFQGCEETACTVYALAEGERFFPWWDRTKTPAP